MHIAPITILYYCTNDGLCPFKEWLNSLRDIRAKIAIDARLTRVEHGLLGDCKLVGGGIFELRVDLGPGYRIYFGRRGSTVIILLHGGNKKTQNKDIKRAQQAWDNYLKEA